MIILPNRTFYCAVIVYLLRFYSPAAADDPINYSEHIRPIFKTHCVACHNPNRARADLDLSSYESIMRGSGLGEIVIAHQSDESLLYLVVAHEEEPAMPPNGKKIPADQIATIRNWIEIGLPENADSAVTSPVAEADTMASSGNPPANHEDPDKAPSAKVFRGDHMNPVTSIAFSEERKLLAVSGEMQVLLFEMPSREFLRVLPFPEGDVQQLRFDRQGERLLAAGGIPAESGTLVIWELTNFSRQAAIAVGIDTVLAADFIADSSQVIFGGPERILYVADTESFVTTHRLDKHTDWVLQTRSGPDGLYFLSGDRDGGIYAWERESGDVLHTLRGHNKPITGLEIAENDRCVSASEDGTIRVWELHQGEMLKQWMAHEDGVMAITATAKGQIASIGRDGRSHLWTLEGEKVAEFSLAGKLPTSVASADQSLIVGDYEGSLTVWQPDKLAPISISVPSQELTSRAGDLLVATTAPRPLTMSPTSKGLPNSGNKMTSVDVDPLLPAQPAMSDSNDVETDIAVMLNRANAIESRLIQLQHDLPAMIDQARSSRQAIETYQRQILDLQAAAAAEVEKLKLIAIEAARATE